MKVRTFNFFLPKKRLLCVCVSECCNLSSCVTRHVHLPVSVSKNRKLVTLPTSYSFKSKDQRPNTGGALLKSHFYFLVSVLIFLKANLFLLRHCWGVAGWVLDDEIVKFSFWKIYIYKEESERKKKKRKTKKRDLHNFTN